jgi:hypothetical protein
MRMHIDRLDPFAADHHGQGLACRLLAVRALQHAAAAENGAHRGGRGPGL